MVIYSHPANVRKRPSTVRLRLLNSVAVIRSTLRFLCVIGVLMVCY
nr:MAG TPA: hypothetical protein [Caudoviricetes sp.]